ncbi:hypothetical protein [Halomicrobium salinisoli]|uniref:hypothetical protein n=1 Tax=Halomicrobium salinisoli TaxID=2878391 RepID=UPI001CEFCBC6|nr:hypothetical protein [Halomicrobium salinisoli]
MSISSTLLDLLCANRERMRVVIGLLIVCAVMLGLSALYVGPGDRSFPLLVIDLVLVGGGLAFFGGSYWYCTKRAMNE